MPTIKELLYAPSNGSVEISVSYLDAPNKFKFKSVAKQLSQQSLLAAVTRPTDGDYKIRRLLGEFKGEVDNEPIKYFDSDLVIRIEYSPLAWELSKDPISGVPNVAYLARENGGWASNWVLFVHNGNDVKIAPPQPPSGDSPGVVQITVQNLPDPLIGDC